MRAALWIFMIGLQRSAQHNPCLLYSQDTTDEIFLPLGREENKELNQ